MKKQEIALVIVIALVVFFTLLLLTSLPGQTTTTAPNKQPIPHETQDTVAPGSTVQPRIGQTFWLHIEDKKYVGLTFNGDSVICSSGRGESLPMGNNGMIFFCDGYHLLNKVDSIYINGSYWGTWQP